MCKLVSLSCVAALLCACADAPPTRWSDDTGAGRSAAELQRDLQRCRAIQAGDTIDTRERVKADDCSTARATSVSCVLSDNARRTSGDDGASDACMRAAGWVRESTAARRN
jgi:hypothetical protein